MNELLIPKKVYVTDNLIISLKDALTFLPSRHFFVLYSKSAMTAEVLDAFQLLEQQSLTLTFHAMSKGEPTMRMLAEGVEQFVMNKCDGIIALGGGSVIDLAKGITAIAKNNAQKFHELAEYQTVERYPLIAIPTTAGTGAEATKIAVLIDEDKGVKYNPGHPDLIPDVAILVPSLTYTLPAHITAHTGLDALTHAIEAYVSTKASKANDNYCLQAIHLISSHLLAAFKEPNNFEARKQMLLGSYYAGIAISNASTNLAHATGRALGTAWNVPHGLSVALMHPFVVELCYESCLERYRTIEQHIGLTDGESLTHYLMQLNNALGIWDDASFLLNEDYARSLELMTKNALSGNGILTNRFTPTAAQVKQLYQKVFNEIQRTHSIQS